MEGGRDQERTSFVRAMVASIARLVLKEQGPQERPGPEMGIVSGGIASLVRYGYMTCGDGHVENRRGRTQLRRASRFQTASAADKWSPMPESGNSERCRLLDNQVDEEEDEPDK